MGRPRWSIGALMVVVAVVGFDAAVMARAVQQGRAAHSPREYAMLFGAILLVLNLDVFALVVYYAKGAGASRGGLLKSNPPPHIIAGTYLAVLAFAILSVLFFTAGRI